MSDTPLVSVIINVHNGAHFIRQAIDSVYRQTYPNFEILIYDNCSTDQLNETIKGYDERLRVVRSEEFLELGEARNKAIAETKGEILGFLDSDDVMLPEKLEKQVPFFNVYIALVYSNSIFFWEDDGRESVLYADPQREGMIFRELFRDYNISLETVLIRRSALDDDPNWWFPIDFTMCEETDLFIRLAYKYPFAYVHEPLAKYRIHAKNWSHTRMELFIKDSLEMLERLEVYIPDFKKNYFEDIRYFEGGISQYQGQYHWQQKQSIKAARAFLKAFSRRRKLYLPAYALLSLLVPHSALVKFKKAIGKY